MKLSTIRIKWKILSLTLLGPVAIATLLAWQRIDDIRSGAEAAIISKSSGIVLMAEAAREQMSKKLQTGVIKPFDQLIAANILDAVPEVTENVVQVSTVSGSAAQDITEVSQAAAAISQGSTKVKTSVGDLTAMADKLKELVRHFKV